METAALRDKLHKYIDLAEESKIEEIYAFLEEEIATYNYDEQNIKLFHARRNKHLNGESISYTAAESLEIIRGLKK